MFAQNSRLNVTFDREPNDGGPFKIGRKGKRLSEIRHFFLRHFRFCVTLCLYAKRHFRGCFTFGLWTKTSFLYMKQNETFGLDSKRHFLKKKSQLGQKNFEVTIIKFTWKFFMMPRRVC